MRLIDYIGLNGCLIIPYYYGFMSGYELIACFITIPLAVTWWTMYAAIMNAIHGKKK